MDAGAFGAGQVFPAALVNAVTVKVLLESSQREDHDTRIVERGDIGDTVALETSARGIVLVPGERKDQGDDLIRTLESEPRRTGRPGNPRPAQMKSIWRDKNS